MEAELYSVLQASLTFWGELSKAEKSLIAGRAISKDYLKNDILHYGGQECAGLFIILSGRLRAYIVTEQGKEISVFRLEKRDLCIFSASCISKNIRYDVWISAETDVKTILIPSSVFSRLIKNNVAAANFVNELITSRMADVMWVLEQILFMSFDKRLAKFLLSESELEGSDTIHLTHEQVANHMGSAREVVTRMLKYFSEEKMISLARGRIILLNKRKLRKLVNSLAS